MPRVDATPDVALLLVQPVNVRRAVSQNEAVPANSTPLGVLVVALLGGASLALETRQVRRVGELRAGS